MVHSTVFVNGTRCNSGRRQLVTPKPASATDAPINFKKLRRDHSSPFNCAAPDGNSRSSQARNSGVSLSSAALRQYWRPLFGSGGWVTMRFIDDRSGNSRRGLYSSAPLASGRSRVVLIFSSSQNLLLHPWVGHIGRRTPLDSHHPVSNPDS